jgi:D-alanyl-D-alanine carboxypeptidase
MTLTRPWSPSAVVSSAAVIFAAIALALCVGPLGKAAALSPVSPPPPPSRGSLDRAVTAIAADRQGPPGLLMLVHRPGGDELYRAGVADTRTGAPLRRGDHIRIASVAKTFNGAVALSLAARGELSLDQTVAAGLPGLLPLAGPVTLSQLLQHTGGVPEYIRSKAFGKRLSKDPAAYFSPRQLLGFVDHEPLEFTPGSRYRYSDTDNIVAGLMAEAASGSSYESLLAALVYKPIGLRETSLPRTVAMPRPFVHGYDVVPGKSPEDVSELINPAGAWASGGIVSTPAELGRFIRAYVGGRLFDSTVRAAQFQFRHGSSSPPGPGANSSGLSLFRYETPCGAVFGHTGSFPGYRLFAAASEDGSRSVVFVANAQIVPGAGSQRVSDAMRRVQRLAVCRALR